MPERFWINPEDGEDFSRELQNKTIQTKELNLKDSKGRRVYVTFFSSFTKDAHGKTKGIQGVLQDITAKKELVALREAEKSLHVSKQQLQLSNEQLRSAIDHAEVANRAKSQFLANMSHEIRTPMSAIVGFSDILAEESPTEIQEQYIDIIRNSGKHLLRVIDDILDFSKIEADEMHVASSECSIDQILNAVEPIMNTAAKKKGLDFKVQTNSDLPVNIVTDPGRLQQCLINLINNAIKFTKEGHVHLNVSLEERDDHAYIRFDVEDTGIGIPDEMQEEIFKPFAQADESYTRKYGGTGLGLAITKQLTELLGSQLTVTSQKDVGSVFSLVIPAGLDVTKQPLFIRGSVIENTDNSEKAEGRLEFSGHVLVTEDIRTNQILIETLLNKMGVDVTIAEDGDDAVKEVLAQDFDLILMDMQMPRMNGYETTAALRKEGITTPIIALTANAMKGDDKKCLQAGCDGYLSKPIDRTKLVEMLDKYLSVKAV